MNQRNLPKKLADRPFSLQEAVKAGLSKYALSKLIKSSVLERIQHGIYQVSKQVALNIEDEYRAATLMCEKPSSVCLLSALEYYHLTDQIPDRVWMLVPNEKRVAANNLKLVRSRNPRWEIGIKKHNGYSITTIERTLIDALLAKRTLGSTVVLEALKTALREKKVTLSRLVNTANSLNVLSKILPYIEALSV